MILKNLKIRLKILILAIFHFTLFIIPEIGVAQEINGIVKSKTSTIYFEDFGLENIFFNGEIHSNISGSKYTVNLKNDQEEFEGIITDKLSKFNVDLNFKSNKIEGQIKRSTNHTKDEWDIQFFGQNLSGTVIHNAMNTVDTYDLSYGNSKIEGTIRKKINTLVYDLMFNKKKVSGTMSLNATAVKHTYNLTAEELTEDEFVVLLFIESIKLINERIDDIDNFQDNK